MPYQEIELLVESIVTDSDNNHPKQKQRFPLDRRSGVDRRSDVDRRIQNQNTVDSKERRVSLNRRSKLDQRSGVDRRLLGQELSDQNSLLKERSFTEDDFTKRSSGLFSGLISAIKHWLFR